MRLPFPQLEVPLPSLCWAFTSPAREVFKAHRGWQVVNMLAQQALEDAHRTGIEGLIAWFCPMEGPGFEGQPVRLVAIAFTADHVSGMAPEGLAETGAKLATQLTMASLPLVPQGAQPLPETAFPVMAIHNGRVHQVWIDDPEQPVALFLDWDPKDDDLGTFGVTSPEELHELFTGRLPGLLLNFVEDGEPTGAPEAAEIFDDERLRIERLKIAFSWQFCYMVAQADGELKDRERQFMRRAFPASMLHAAQLTDEQGNFREPFFSQAKAEALRVLPKALGVQEKIDLLSLLQQLAMADGELSEEEVEVFSLVAELLDVDESQLPWGASSKE